MKRADEILLECLGEEVEYTEEMILKAMKQYAQQFIDSASSIINPASDILPDTYDEELDAWDRVYTLNL